VVTTEDSQPQRGALQLEVVPGLLRVFCRLGRLEAANQGANELNTLQHRLAKRPDWKGGACGLRRSKALHDQGTSGKRHRTKKP